MKKTLMILILSTSLSSFACSLVDVTAPAISHIEEMKENGFDIINFTINNESLHITSGASKYPGVNYNGQSVIEILFSYNINYGSSGSEQNNIVSYQGFSAVDSESCSQVTVGSSAE